MVFEHKSVIGILVMGTLTLAPLAWAEDSGNSQIVYQTAPRSSQVTSVSSGKGDLDVNVTVITAASYSPGDQGITDVTASTSATRWAKACGSPSGLSQADARALIKRMAEETGQDVKLSISLALAESQLNHDQVSDKGAIGLMQLMPETAKRLGLDPCKPSENVRGGLAYLAQLQTQFGNPVYALAAYNAGPDRIDQYHGVPPYKETLDYIAKILTNYYGEPQTLASNGNSDATDTGQAKSEPVKIVAAKTKSITNHVGPEWKSGFVMNFD